MEVMLGLLALLALLEFLAVPILFVLVLSDRSHTGQRLNVLARRIASLEAKFLGATSAAEAPPESAPAAVTPLPPAPESPSTPEPSPVAIARAEPEAQLPQPVPTPAPTAAAAPTTAAPPRPPA